MGPIERVEKRVKKKKKIINDTVGWVIVSIILFTINIFTSNTLWCIWPIGFYGLSVLIGNIKTVKELYLDDWEEKEIRKELKKNNYEIVEEEELNLDYNPMKKKVKSKVWNDRDLV